MSDYLTNLAARALRAQNMVRPKLPSRYERTPSGPVTTNPEDSFFRNSPISQIEEESESFDASPSSQASSVSEPSVFAHLDRPDTLKLATPALGDVRSAQLAQSRSSDNSLRSDRFRTDLNQGQRNEFGQPGAPEPEQQRVEREHRALLQSSAPTKAVTPLQEVVESKETGRRHVEAVSERVVRSNHRLTPPAIESIFQHEGFPSTETVTAETETAGESTGAFDQKSTQEASSIKVRPAIIASKILDSGHSPARESGPQPVSKAETTVNVSIGRVEVRAVQAPATQPTSPRDSVGSAMPLDEYLEKRRKGGQR